MKKCPTNDVHARIKRAQTLFKSFQEEDLNNLSPAIPCEINFILNGQEVKFEMHVDDLGTTIDLL